MSVSLNKTILAEMGKIQESHGFSGRSELIRAGIRSLLSDDRKRKEIKGSIYVLFFAIHDEKSDQQVNKLRHAFDKLINTHLHSKIERDRCLEIFLLKGDANDVNEMAKQFQSIRNMEKVELVVVK